MRRALLLGFVAAIALQFLVLIGMYLSAQMPLWTGTEIRLQTVPVDPRSLFRGNYARLAYEVSELDSASFPDRNSLRQGEVVYVSLRAGKDGLYRLVGAGLEKPDSGVFLRGRVTDNWLRDSTSYYRVKYGIEAFFAPKEKALGMESDLRNGGVARLMVSHGGKARLKDVIANATD